MTNDENYHLFNRETPPADWDSRIAELVWRLKMELARHQAWGAHFEERKAQIENEIAAIRNRTPAPYSPETGA